MIVRAASRPWADAAALILLKACATALVLWSGFRAISDDDYARVVIAQRFAEIPALDPSGSSWLPLPFYVYGAALRLLGSSLEVAQTVAITLGLASALLGLWAARVLGLGRWGTFLGAGLGALFPYSAYLGAAMVPEAPTAALALLAAATLESAQLRTRCLGAGALLAATASRYEPWAVAALFAFFTAWDAHRTKNPRFLLVAGLPLAFPALWVLHGIFRHGDAAFFVSRVAAYRAALGPDEPFLARLLRTPKAFFGGEPELAALLVGFALPVLFRTRGPSELPLRRFSLALLAVLGLSLAADLRGTAATHHGERALLVVWLGAALLMGAALESLVLLTARARVAALATAAACALFGSLLRLHVPRQSFAQRDTAVEIGRLARRAGAAPLGIDSPDYAFFAVQAGFGQPSATRVLDDHDPRKPRTPDLLVHDARAFAAALVQSGVTWLVLPQSRAPLAQSFGTVNGENADWVLLKLDRR